MDLSTFTDAAAVIAAALIIVIAGTFVALMIIRKRTRMNISEASRKPVAEKEDVCGICLGPVSKGDMTAGCGCGQIFHDACAKPTDACPYCGRSYSEFTIGSPDRVKCPSCGSNTAGNVCGCGAIVHRDGEFICACGNVLDASDPVCGRCGAEYELCSGRRDV